MADTNTPHYGFIIQQPGTNRSTWGGKLNANWTSIDGLLFTATTDAANSLALATTALPKAGGTMTGDVVLADVAPGSTLSVGFRGLPVVSIDANRTFLNTDAGKMIRCTGTTIRTWTIPPSVHPVGTAIVIRNTSTAALVLARGVGVELRIVGTATDGNKGLSSQGQATLVQEAANIWSVAGVGVT